ncbi:DUF3380 domain-containing protein [Massilia forsythiae]|uniref:DUF3380 domain-containing protein n=1 Tax=Massilia forsythiae TaxID=2728020 RepID=A0A7Z2VUZ1_9BURK|nr:N-acetylmuramidase domain-containing protein [Massilia forsythiae]QJD99466.1 DUF3380 domain-containing protein [Massilia forsythiae]
MVAIVGGNGLGLLNGSAALLGQRGMAGKALQGQDGQAVYVNASNGNLVIQRQDDFLAAVGIDIAVGRTYNSQGKTDDDNGDNWKLGLSRQVTGLSGAPNSVGSTIDRIDGDDTRYRFTYDATRRLYVTTDGGEAFDTLSYDAGTKIWTWQTGTTDLAETYDGTNGGRLLSMVDLDGNRLAFNYQSNGMLASVTDATGAGTFFTYGGPSGKELQSVDVAYRETADGELESANRVEYFYDNQGRLAQVDTFLSIRGTFSTKYTYDGASRRIATIEQSDGNKLTFTYDAGRIATVSDGKYENDTFSYAGNRTTVTDKDGTVTYYTFDNNGQILHTEMAGANGASLNTYFEYDAKGNVTKIVEPNGNVTVKRHDGNGNVIYERDSTGHVVTRTYTATNLLQSETVFRDVDPDGEGPANPADASTTYYVYDAHEHLRFVVDGDQGVQEFRYDQRGQRQAAIAYTQDRYAVTGAAPSEAELARWVAGADKTRAVRTDYGYDIRGLVATATTYSDLAADGSGIRNGMQSVTHFTYDQAGRLLEKIDADGNATAYAYDNLDRLLTTVDAGSNSVRTTYAQGGSYLDLSGATVAVNRTFTTYPNGRVTETILDTSGRTLGVLEKSGTTVLTEVYYAYDAEGRLAMVQDANGNRNFTLYDSLGRKAVDIDGDGSVVEYKYDAKGQLGEVIQRATRLDANLRGTRLINMRPEQLRLQSSALDVHEWRFYDAAGRLAESVDGAGNVTSTVYDGVGRMLAEIQRYTPVDVALGSPKGVPPAASANDRMQRYFYTNDGKPAGEVDAAGYLTEYRYDGAGQLVETVRYAGLVKKPDLTSALADFRPAAGDASHADDIHEYNLYDAKGQLVAEIDGENYLTVRSYDAAGNLGRTVRYANRVAFQPGQTTLAQVLAQDASGSQSITYTYDALNHLRSVTGVDGSITRYEYDAVGNRTSTTSAYNSDGARNGLVRYDALGRVTAELTGVGAARLALVTTPAQQEAVWTAYATRYTYDKANHRTTMTDPNGHVTRYYYDKDGRLAATVNAAGEVERREYNAINQVATVTRYAQRIGEAELAGMAGGEFGLIESRLALLRDGAHDYVATYGYDADGRMTSRSDENGTHTLSYDSFNQLTLDEADIGDGRIAQSRYTYTVRGELQSQYDGFTRGEPKLSRSFISRDAFGRVIYSQTTDGDGETYRYDRLGRQIAVTSAEGVGGTTTYDAFDRVVTETSNAGGTTTYRYDTAARSMTVTTAEGAVHTVVRTAQGDVAELIDLNGEKTTYAYDQDGHLKSVSDKFGVSEAHTYDFAGNLTTTTDGNGSVTKIEYDSVDRVLRRTVDVDGLNLVTSYTYDTQGRTLTVTDPTGVMTATTYDVLGRVQTTVRSAEPGGLALTTSFDYDNLGHVLRMTDPAGHVTEYQYDIVGRRIATIVDPDGLRLTTIYVYDDLGTAPFRSYDAKGNVTHYMYDADGRKVGEVDAAGDVTVYTYEQGSDRIASVTRYARPLVGATVAQFVDDGVRLDLATVQEHLAPDPSRDNVTTYLYDQDGRLHFTVEGDRSFTQQRYDGNGRLAETTQYSNLLPPEVALTDAAVRAWVPAGGSGEVSVSYTYDVRGRVAQQTNAAGGVTTYTYDGNFNVIASITGSPETGTVAAKRMVYDGAGRLVASAVKQYGDEDASYWSVSTQAYDGAGRVIDRTDYVTHLSDAGLAPDATQAQVVAWLATVPASYGNDARVRMRYDAAGRLVASATAQRGDANTLLWSVTRQEFDADGNVLARTSYANFLGGAPAQGTLSDGQMQEWLAGVAVDGTRDSTTRYVYDSVNRLNITIDALGGVVRREYDGAGNVLAEIAYANPVRLSGAVTREAVLAALESHYGQPWNPEGDRVTYYDYDAANRVAVMTNAVGVATSYVYDGAGHLVRQVDNANNEADYRVHRTVYGADGLPRLSIDPEGYVTETRYNGLGLVSDSIRYATQIVVGDDASVADVLGLVDTSDPQTRRTQSQYDNQGNLVTSVDAMGKAETYTYDALGRKASYTNRNGATWTYAYDAAGRLLVERAPAVLVPNEQGIIGMVEVETHMAYDAMGRMTSRTEGYGGPHPRTTSYGYDLVGRQVRTTLPLTAVYDPASDPLSAADADYHVIHVAPFTTVTYDALGNAVEGTDANGNVSRKVYDVLGRVVFEIDALQNVTGYEYDAFGGVEKLTRYAEGLNALADPDKAAKEDIGKLYVTMYNRAPDGGGLNYWLQFLKQGQTLAQVADTILKSKESAFFNLPGMSLPDYVARIFDTAFGRAPSEAETTYWTNIGSAEGVTRGQLLVRMIGEAPTQRDQDFFVNKVEDYLHPQMLSSQRYRISLIYTAVLGRAPSAAELADGMTYLASGGSEAGLVHVLMDGTEGRALYPQDMDGAALVTLLSEHALGREPGQDLQWWTGAAENASSRAQAVLDFLAGRAIDRGDDDDLNLELRAKRNMPANPVGYGPVTDFSLATMRSAVELHASILDRAVDTQYDGLGRKIKVAEAATYNYTAVGGYGNDETWMGYAELRKVTSFDYDAFGDVTAKKVYGVRGDFRDGEQLGEAAVTRMYYNRRGEKTAEFVLADTENSNRLAHNYEDKVATDSGGYLTRMEYDAFGNLTRTYEYAQRSRDPRGPEDGLYDMNPESPALTESDRDTRYEYDLNDRKQAQLQVNTAFDNFTWDGNYSALRDTLVTSYEYDGVGNLTSTTDPLGNTVLSFYDAVGRVTRVASRNDGVGRSQIILRPEPLPDPEPQPTPTPPYDPENPNDPNRVWIVTDFVRDAYGNVLTQIAHAKYQALYDGASSPMLASADDRTTSTTYDLMGNALAVTDGNLNITRRSYDAAGRLAKEWQTVTDRSSATSAVTLTSYKLFHYDATGQMTSVTTPGSTNAMPLPAVGVASVESAPGSFDPSQTKSIFTGTNTISVRFPDTGNAPIRVVVDYTQADNPQFKLGLDGFKPIWIPNGVKPGDPAQKTFSYPAAEGELPLQRTDGGATLIWSENDQVGGGIKSVQRVKVYVQNANGEWELRQDFDGSVAPLSSTIVDKAPADIGRNVQSLTYNAFGEVTSRSMNGNVYEFAEYDNAGNVWHTNAGDGITKVMFYDIRGNLTQQATGTDHAGGTLDDLRLYTSAKDVHDALSTPYLEVKGVDVVETRYDLMDRAVLHLDAARVDGTVKLAEGQPDSVAMRTPTSHVKYDRWGNVVEVTDPRNLDWRITYSYNSFNQQTEKSVVLMNGGVPTVRSSELNYYDEMGRATGNRDANGNLTFTGYFGFGLSTTRFADGSGESYAVNAFGERTSLQARDGYATLYTYDHMGNLASSSRYSSHVYYTVDQSDGGGMTALLNPGNWEVREEFAYDELGRRYATSTQKYPANAGGQSDKIHEVISSLTRYDLAGNVVAQIDNAGRQTRSVYDAYGHKVAEVDGAGKSMTWNVDAFGRVVGHVDQGGAQIRYEYDGQGHLIHQWSTARQGSGAQNIVYTYDHGLLTTIDDHATGLLTTYTYDLTGNRVTEKALARNAEGGPLLVQNNTIRYDQYGRMEHVEDGHFTVDIGYDDNGNRLHVATHYVDSSGRAVDSDAWNKYDEMNREVVANGINVNGNIVMGDKGHVITYDGFGRRETDSYMYKDAQKGGPYLPTTERYQYEDDTGRLSQVTRDGIVIDRRYYDEFGRVIRSGPPEGTNNDRLKSFGIAGEYRTYHYTKGGELQRLKFWALNHDFLDDIYYLANGAEGGYDGAGNPIGYAVVHPHDDGTGRQHSIYFNTYAYFDSAKEIQVRGSINGKPEYTTTTLDANGNVVKVVDTSAPGKDRTYINDAEGRVLMSTQSGEMVRTLIVNGEVLGSNSDEADPSNFANAYQSATTGANLASPSIYHVQGGENLKSIAKSVWGDANLWYLIANANNLEVDSPLTIGQTLRLPARANVVHNDADTFTPYNPSDAIGSTTPTLPLPARSDASCGSKLVIIAVTLAVTFATQGLATSWLGGGGAWLSSILGSTGAAAASLGIGAAAGSIAGQAIAIDLGVRDSFSWGEVFTSAVGAAVSGGLNAKVGGDWWDVAKNAAIANASSQAVGIALNLQKGFQWKSVLGSAISAGVGRSLFDSQLLSGTDKVYRSIISQTAGQTLGTFASGGKVSSQSIAIDVFGNVLASNFEARRDPNKNQISNGNQTAFLNNSKFSENEYGQLRARLAEYGTDARADFATDEELKALESAADSNGGVLPKAGEFLSRPEISVEDLTSQRVIVVGKRLSIEDQEAWYKQQMRSSMPDYGRSAPTSRSSRKTTAASRQVTPVGQLNVRAVAIPPTKPQINVSEAAFANAARKLNVEVAAIKAVAEVESKGNGFFSDGRPKILFERHYFHRLTNGVFDASNPEISNSISGGYGASGDNQYRKLDIAFALDNTAALKSTSWGQFQIMGANYRAAGYNSVTDFVDSQRQGADVQLKAFADFVGSDRGLLNALREKDWSVFARKYNGPNYRENNYDNKMREAYEKYKN